MKGERNGRKRKVKEGKARERKVKGGGRDK